MLSVVKSIRFQYLSKSKSTWLTIYLSKSKSTSYENYLSKSKSNVLKKYLSKSKRKSTAHGKK